MRSSCGEMDIQKRESFSTLHEEKAMKTVIERGGGKKSTI